MGSWETAAGRWPSLRVAAASGMVAILCAGCSEAPARCRAEVAASFERLRTSGTPYRKETTMAVGDHQTFREIAEYIPPDRMHDVSTNRVGEVEADGVRLPAHQITSEVIRVGARAWEKEESGWREWEPWLVQELYGAGMDFLLLPGRVVPADAAFECLGPVEFHGTLHIGYRSRLDKRIVYVAPTNAKDREELEARLQQELQQMPQEWRTVFVDKWSGLPAYDIIAAENKLDKPRYGVHFTYPGDIKIDPPVP